MKKVTACTFSGFLFLSAIMFSCKEKERPPATVFSFSELCNDQAILNYKLLPEDGKIYMALEGYPRLPEVGVPISTMGVDLFEKPGGNGKRADINLLVGVGNNQVEKPPEKYTPDDLKIHTYDGRVVGVTDRIRVHGELKIRMPDETYSHHRCRLEKIYRIEKIR